jgi:DNA-directed RNA polymerase specialized sigma24 family protein
MRDMADPSSGFHANEPTLRPGGKTQPGGKTPGPGATATRLQAALEQLPAREREALELKVLAGRPLRQLADQLKLSETDVARLLLDAARQLTRHLENNTQVNSSE